MSRDGTPLDQKTEHAIFEALHSYAHMELCDCSGDDCKHARRFRTARENLRRHIRRIQKSQRKRSADAVRLYRSSVHGIIQRRVLRAAIRLIEQEPAS